MPAMMSGGNIFDPVTAAGDQPQNQAMLMSQVMDPANQPMQPPQSPEEHAQAKQSWMDWFKNPSTSAFLMQFGASMLQPNVRGFGAQLGQSIGEGGAAVGRLQEQELKAQEQEAQAQELAGRGAYYKAEGEARPLEAQAAIMKASADVKDAATRAAQLPLDQQKLAIQQQLGETRLQLQAAGVDNATIALTLKQQEAQYNDALKAAQTALTQAKTIDPMVQYRADQYFQALSKYYEQGGAQGIGAMPDPKAYGLTPEQAGQIAASTTGGAPTTGAPATTGGGTQPDAKANPMSTLPDYQDTPGMQKMLDEATPSDLFKIGQEYMRRGMPPAQWEQIRLASMKRRAAAAGQ